MTFAFHAAAPPGEWINDPNGLIYADGRYYLFAQHSASAPDFRDIGWGRLSSDDLLSWRWNGVALPQSAAGSAYSGSIAATPGGWEAYYTRHDPAGPWQSQHRATSSADATGLREHADAIGPAGRNMRDPFVFRSAVTADWRMLVAQPCDWTNWHDDLPSRLQIWRSPDRETWNEAGTIGPWSPPGVMWEVPVLLDLGARHALVVSTVDRRKDRADCSVRYWIGTWSGSAFTPDPGMPGGGLPLDLGPDFYAAIANTQDRWPTSERVLVAWASNWHTARRVAWPADARGGPITLPRLLDFDEAHSRLRQRPVAAAEPLARWTAELPGEAPFTVTLERGAFALTVEGDPDTGVVRVARRGGEPFDWQARHDDVLSPTPARRFTIFEDGPLLELFIAPDGLTVTVILLGDGPLRIDSGTDGT